MIIEIQCLSVDNPVAIQILLKIHPAAIQIRSFCWHWQQLGDACSRIPTHSCGDMDLAGGLGDVSVSVAVEDEIAIVEKVAILEWLRVEISRVLVRSHIVSLIVF